MREPNPVLVKGLREETRSRKLFFLVPVYVALLSVVALVAVGSNEGVSFNPVSLSGTARVTLYSFTVAIGILLGLISMVLGASTFTTEREKFTYELLEMTPLPYRRMVVGKFLHVMVLLLFILISSLPVFSTLFFMGGLNYIDLLLSLYYLVLFLAAITLAGICISIVASRTIFAITLCLAVAFVLAILSSFVTAAINQEPKYLGFGIFIPWLVLLQQIFSPAPLKLLGHSVPVWPFYTLLYALVCMLLVSWGRNALDTRKLERNSWSRVLGILILNYQAAIGVACWKSYPPMATAALNGIYATGFCGAVVLLPFFVLGPLSDREFTRFARAPLAESLSPARIWCNSPLTGAVYMLILVLSAGVTVTVVSRTPWGDNLGYLSFFAAWILPWFLAFAGLRLAGLQARGLFVSYLLGTTLYSIICAFQASSGKTTDDLFAFFLAPEDIVALCIAGTACYVLGRARNRRRRATQGPVTLRPAEGGGRNSPPRVR